MEKRGIIDERTPGVEVQKHATSTGQEKTPRQPPVQENSSLERLQRAAADSAGKQGK